MAGLVASPLPLQAAGWAGDTGLAALRSSPPARGLETRLSAIPYVYGDWGPAFARIDTFGLKTVELGYGALELAGRLGQDGFDPAKAGYPTLAKRVNSTWLGVGTFQTTPYGGVFAHVFRDLGRSRGTWLDTNYVARFEWGRVKVYPSLGLEWQDARYARYYFSLPSDTESPGSSAPVSPGSSWMPKAGVFVDVPVADDWHLIGSWRVKRRPSSLSDSPLVPGRTDTTTLLGVVYRWK